MRIAIIGAGAVGGYYGARLAAAGHDVTFVARGANLLALRERGIEVRSQLGDIGLKVGAESDPSKVQPVELVVLAVKTYSNAGALKLLPPLAERGAAVLTLQNGVESAEDVAAVVGEAAVLGGSTYIAAELVAPGVVQHTGVMRRIVFGEAFGERVRTPRVARVAEALAVPGIEVEGVADYRVALWEKFIFLAPIAGFCAAARQPVGGLWRQPTFRELLGRTMAEVEAVARAEGVTVAADVVQQKLDYLGSWPNTRPSLMMDIVAGRPLEVEALMGAVVRRGRVHGVPTPIMDALYAVLEPFKDGKQA